MILKLKWNLQKIKKHGKNVSIAIIVMTVLGHMFSYLHIVLIFGTIIFFMQRDPLNNPNF